jgi:hypothetical protein
VEECIAAEVEMRTESGNYFYLSAQYFAFSFSGTAPINLVSDEVRRQIRRKLSGSDSKQPPLTTARYQWAESQVIDTLDLRARFRVPEFLVRVGYAQGYHQVTKKLPVGERIINLENGEQFKCTLGISTEIADSPKMQLTVHLFFSSQSFNSKEASDDSRAMILGAVTKERDRIISVLNEKFTRERFHQLM